MSGPQLPVAPHLQRLADELAALAPAERALVLAVVQAAPAMAPAYRDVLYVDEVAALLGLDRLARPDNAVQRLISRRDLTPLKLGGRLVFRRGQVEQLVQNGGRRSRRGRPPGSRTIG